MSLQPVLIAGQWRAAQSRATFRAENPASGETLPDEFPMSAWADDEVALTAAQAAQVLNQLEGNLTGSIYSVTPGVDDALYAQLAPLLRVRVGGLLNDKMPTGVVVSPAMNHGGPFPATGHPGFTAISIPASLRRFAVLQCFDNVRPHRLPAALRDKI